MKMPIKISPPFINMEKMKLWGPTALLLRLARYQSRSTYP